MARPIRHDSPALHSLERHRAALLQEARVQQARSETLLEKAEAGCAAAERRLESALARQRVLENGGAVAAQDIQWAYQYACSRAVALSQSRGARDGRRHDLSLAQEQVLARLKELKTIERLRERLRRAAAKWDLRQDQSRLDGLGIVRGLTGEAL